jgi:hypothetical protein
MGVDINSHTGVVVRATDLVAAVVTPDNRKQAAQLLLQLTARTLAELNEVFERKLQDDRQHNYAYQQNQNLAAMLVEVFDQLSVDSTVEDIRVMLGSMTKAVEDGFNSGDDPSEAVSVWKYLFEGLFPEAPSPKSTEFIRAPRYQGWDLPQGEVLFVFPEEECFKRIKTEKGDALDQILGIETHLSTWTSYGC